MTKKSHWILLKDLISSKFLNANDKNQGRSNNGRNTYYFIQLSLSYDTPANRKRLLLFYNPPINFSRRTHLDRSFIFCGFFSRFLVRNCQPAVSFLHHWPLQNGCFLFHDQLNVQLDVCWSLLVSWFFFGRNKIRRRISKRTADILR